MEDLKYLLERKSMRSFQERTIPKDVKEKLFKATLRAPTAGNMMMYSILEITDQKIKNQLVKTCDNQGFIGKSPLVLVFLADFQRWMDFLEASGVKEYNLENNLEEYCPNEGDLFLSINDALIAAQNSVIAGEILGLGSCYIGDIMENFEIHKELLNLPKYTFPITMLCFGYPTEQQKNRPKRNRYKKEFIIFENKYKRLTDIEFKEFDDNALHMYKRKITSSFMKEMGRSIRAGINSWISK